MSYSFTARRKDGNPTADAEHQVWRVSPSGEVLSTETLCGLPTKGMVPVDWKSEPWVFGCRNCALEVLRRR